MGLYSASVGKSLEGRYSGSEDGCAKGVPERHEYLWWLVNVCRTFSSTAGLLAAAYDTVLRSILTKAWFDGGPYSQRQVLFLVLVDP